jgi:hypothetical protein
VLGGARDHVFWPLEFTLTARLLGADKAQDLPNAPHDLMLAPGWEEAAGEIVGWLKKNHL